MLAHARYAMSCVHARHELMSILRSQAACMQMHTSELLKCNESIYSMVVMY